MLMSSCNYIESLLGIETSSGPDGLEKSGGCNYIESLLGIETLRTPVVFLRFLGCNYIESLLGIETVAPFRNPLQIQVATILNPY